MQYKMEKNFSDGFSARLRSLRGTDTLEVFAGKIDVSLPTYQHYESGRRKPTLQFIIQVAEVCGVSTDWLLGVEKQNGEIAHDCGLLAGLRSFRKEMEAGIARANAFLESIDKLEKKLGTMGGGK